MLRQRSLIAAALSLLLFWPGLAAQASDDSHYDRIHLSVSAQEEVDNDTLLVVMSARAEGEELSALADAVNRTVNQAIEQSKQVPAVEVRTLAYQTQPRYQKQRLIGWQVRKFTETGVIRLDIVDAAEDLAEVRLVVAGRLEADHGVFRGWQVRQAIELKSGDIEALSSLLGRWQKTMAIDSLKYTVSSARREAMEQTLISRAIEQFQQRAEHVTRQLGRKEFRLVNMKINTNGQTANPRMMRSVSAMSESAATAPTMEPGTQTLQVNINAMIELTVN